MSKDGPDKASPLTDDVVKADAHCSTTDSAKQESSSPANTDSVDWLGWLVSGAVVMICKPVIENLLTRLKHIGPDGMDFYPPEKKETPNAEMPAVKQDKNSSTAKSLPD
jgi:hypothetical protein